VIDDLVDRMVNTAEIRLLESRPSGSNRVAC